MKNVCELRLTGQVALGSLAIEFVADICIWVKIFCEGVGFKSSYRNGEGICTVSDCSDINGKTEKLQYQ